MAITNGVYCRFWNEDRIQYGKIIDDTIDTLKRAPWDDDSETGQKVALKSVHLLFPCEPKVIVGLAGACKESYTNRPAPKSVRWFLKPVGSAASPGDDIVLPDALDEVRVESELVIVIGKTIKNAVESEASEAIFGYTVGNDIGGSEESYHRLQGEPPDQKEPALVAGLKIGDRFAPFGPFIHRGVDWRNRDRSILVKNIEKGKELKARHNTSNLYYRPEKIVSDLSNVLTLSAGDVIFTGANQSFPAQGGDEVTVAIDGLGTLVNKIKTASRNTKR